MGGFVFRALLAFLTSVVSFFLVKIREGGGKAWAPSTLPGLPPL